MEVDGGDPGLKSEAIKGVAPRLKAVQISSDLTALPPKVSAIGLAPCR